MSVFKLEISRTPFHKHDCNKCTYHGSVFFAEEWFDMYSHKQPHGIELIARFGTDGDYICKPFEIVDAVNPKSIMSLVKYEYESHKVLNKAK